MLMLCDPTHSECVMVKVVMRLPNATYLLTFLSSMHGQAHEKNRYKKAGRKG